MTYNEAIVKSEVNRAYKISGGTIYIVDRHGCLFRFLDTPFLKTFAPDIWKEWLDWKPL